MYGQNNSMMQIKDPMSGAMPLYGASTKLSTTPQGGVSPNVGAAPGVGAGAPGGVSASSSTGGAAPTSNNPNYGGIWDAISRIMSGGKGGVDFNNPANAAMPFFDQIEGKISPYYKPYQQAGNQALPELQKRYMELLSDPSAFMKKISGGFQASPGYQYNVDQATGAANRAAAAGGMLGTPAEQAELAKTVHGLADQDYGQYMDRALGLHSQGLQGLEGINEKGYRANDTMANNIASILATKGNLAFSGAQQQNMQKMIEAMMQGRQDDSMFGGIGDLIKQFSGGGFGKLFGK